MLTSISVKFIFNSVCFSLSSSANILQIADVALRVVFLLVLLCFQLLFRPVPAVVLTLEMSEVLAIFVFTTKTTQLRPHVFSVMLMMHLPVAGCIFDVSSSLNTKFFQIWSSLTGYSELCMCFQQIRIGEIFSMNNKKNYLIFMGNVWS